LIKDKHVLLSPLQISNQSYYLSPNEIGPIVYKSVKPKGTKYVNVFGLYAFILSLITCPPWVIAMTAVQSISKIFKKFDPNQALFDKTGKIWSKTWLRLGGMYPTFSGAEHKKIDQGGPWTLYIRGESRKLARHTGSLHMFR